MRVAHGRFDPATWRSRLALLGLAGALFLLAACAPKRGVETAPGARAAGPSESGQGGEAARPAPDEPASATPEAEPPAVADAETAGEGDDEAEQEADDAAEALPGEEVSESPLDQLGEVAPDIDAGALDEERELAEATGPVFDIPMEVNDRVLFWIDFYAHRKSDFFQASLERSGRYLEGFQQIFREQGLPVDLVHMAHVESAFKTTAYSRARARGIFQFIASTGRRYGLRIDHWVDERVDPEKSARASAAYLKDLHDEFGDWYLALAAYNAGEGKIRSALRRSGRKDFWGIAGTRYIRRETKNYVPAILAATMIAKAPEKYGFSYTPEPPLEFESIEVDGAADLRVLARCAGTDVETLKLLNPALRLGQTPPAATTSVRVPPGRGEATLAALALVPPGERVTYVRHVVRRGDTLSEVARKYGVSIAAIQQANRMGRRTVIHVGQALVVPTAAAGRSGAATSAVASSGAVDGGGEAGEPLTYRVRRGDSLSRIAQRYDTSPAAIAAASGIRVDSVLSVGQRLTVVPGERRVAEARSRAGRPAPAPSTVVESRLEHRVGAGETLSTIAQRYGTTADAVARANGRSIEDTLQVGDRLVIIPGVSRVHTVRRGETLWKIARRYRTTVEDLCALNRISRDAPLHPGTKLTVVVD